jgi:superfamily II DNA or RNA helicase
MIQSLIDIVNDDSSLRPYQVNSKKQIYQAWLSVRSVLFQMPTGTGKTRLFSSIIKDVRSVSVQKTIIPMDVL